MRHEIELARQAIREHMIIDGVAVSHSAGERVAVYDPAKAEVIAFQLEAGAEGVDKAVKAARRAFEETWQHTLPAERERLLLQLADVLEANADELARLETLNNGKLLAASYAFEVAASAQWLRYMAGWATKLNGEQLNLSAGSVDTVNYHAYTRLEPVGVVGAIVPWNFPLLIAIWKVAPALAAGCTVVLKPAEETPLTAIRLAELALEAGFPPGVLNVITGRGDITGAALTAHPGVDKLTFTGSTQVGKLIGHQAIDGMKRLSLELGGKSPVVIMQDSDLNAAIEGAAQAIFFNQGQVCTAGSRLFVQEAVYEKVVQGIADIARSLKVGSGFVAETQISPLISARHQQRVQDYIRVGVEQGARMLAGDDTCPEMGYFVRPTVFADVASTARLMHEEVFGPVLVARAFRTEAEALQLSNDTEYGLGASIWTQDMGCAQRLSKGIKAGTVWVNTHGVLDPNMPFGGFKQSGIGREHGRIALDAYLECKSVCIAYPA